jgi:hypothetical protein
MQSPAQVYDTRQFRTARGLLEKQIVMMPM